MEEQLEIKNLFSLRNQNGKEKTGGTPAQRFY